MITVSESLILAPCPLCGGTPLFTQGRASSSPSSARMVCACGFEGEYASVYSLEACYAVWNTAVASENRRRLDCKTHRDIGNPPPGRACPECGRESETECPHKRWGPIYGIKCNWECFDCGEHKESCA